MKKVSTGRFPETRQLFFFFWPKLKSRVCVQASSMKQHGMGHFQNKRSAFNALKYRWHSSVMQLLQEFTSNSPDPEIGKSDLLRFDGNSSGGGIACNIRNTWFMGKKINPPKTLKIFSLKFFHRKPNR